MRYFNPKFWQMTIGFLLLILGGIGTMYGISWYDRGGRLCQIIDTCAGYGTFSPKP